MSGGPVPIWKKYTTGSTGIWEKIRQLLVLVPNRSSGNPVVSFFRAVPPGGDIEGSKKHVEPVTQAGDIKGNPYFKRDFRRNYPQVHSFDQSKISGLLKLGSASSPRVSIGDKGNQELAVFENPDQPISLATTLGGIDKSIINGELLGKQGEPMVAPSLNKFKWEIIRESQSGMYTDSYPCRIFKEVKEVQT